MKKLVIKEQDTIRKRVYNHVREHILTGEIKPHERLVEAKIAADIGTSRTPVREALHSLELEGIIESIPRVGYVVKPINIDEIVEICEIRVVVEGLAARWALNRSREKLISQLRKNIEKAEEQANKGDVKAFIEIDTQFHEIIAKLSGSTRLFELTQVMRRHMLRYRMESIYQTDNVFRAIKGHIGILNALENGNPDEVADAIKAHLEQSKKDIVRFAFKEET
jgi:DNA-binding GntR family transcriptional regulator